MKIKVCVLVENGEISCYHDLKHLCNMNPGIPYDAVYKRLRLGKSIIYKSYLIGRDTIAYKTKRKLPSKNNF